MKAHLLCRDADVDLDRELPPEAADLVADLGLDAVLDAMAGGDDFIRDVASAVLLSGLSDRTSISYRQAALRDCLAHRDIVGQIYDLAGEALALERGVWNFGLRTPDALLRRSLQVLELLVGLLQRLRKLADQRSGEVRSDAFQGLFAVLQRELSDDYFDAVTEHLETLRFPHGVLMSVRLGQGLRGADYVVRSAQGDHRSWWRRLSLKPDRMTVVVPPRDESGLRALEEVRSRGINGLADVLAQSAEHVVSFFQMLRWEAGFYLGCANLHAQLSDLQQPLCFPVVHPGSEHRFCAEGLYDPGLSLRSSAPVVGNDVRADPLRLLAITGANHGGKSTFLRAIGISQLMTQAGMFVPARSLEVTVRTGLFTHFKRGEDTELASGKFDEELQRMSTIVDRLAPSSLVLMNESFSATNETEAAEIGSAIIRGLLDSGVAVVCVTHSFELARKFTGEEAGVRFLRAQRGTDGVRTFRLEPVARCQPALRKMFTSGFSEVRSAGELTRRTQPTLQMTGHWDGNDQRLLAAYQEIPTTTAIKLSSAINI